MASSFRLCLARVWIRQWRTCWLILLSASGLTAGLKPVNIFPSALLAPLGRNVYSRNVKEVCSGRQAKALAPVMSRPTMRVWMVSVPS